FAQPGFDAGAAVGAAQLVVQPLALRRVAGRALRFLELGDPRLELTRPFLDGGAEPGRLRLELRLGHALQTRIVLVDRVDDRLDLFSLAFVPRAEHGADDSL